jgi:hypothetical protein
MRSEPADRDSRRFAAHAIREGVTPSVHALDATRLGRTGAGLRPTVYCPSDRVEACLRDER